jgi:hypothetical protein
MIYTKKFNDWFDTLDTGDMFIGKIEEVKRDMSFAWDYQQEEIEELKNELKRRDEMAEKDLDKLIELADQIEKMKCCGNCIKVRVGRDQDLYCYCDGYTVSHNTSCINWEFNE